MTTENSLPDRHSSWRLDNDEYRPGELSGFYSVSGMGAVIENI